MVSLPPVAAVILSARRCAPTPRPGKFFGQAVTMRQVMLPCAIAGVASAAAPAPTVAKPAFVMNERRSMDYLPNRFEMVASSRKRKVMPSSPENFRSIHEPEQVSRFQFLHMPLEVCCDDC